MATRQERAWRLSAISSRDHLIAKLRNVWRLADAARDAINRAKEKAETDPSLAHGFLILALFYPLVAIGGAILTVAAAVSFHFDQQRRVLQPYRFMRRWYS